MSPKRTPRTTPETQLKDYVSTFVLNAPFLKPEQLLDEISILANTILEKKHVLDSHQV